MTVPVGLELDAPSPTSIIILLVGKDAMDLRDLQADNHLPTRQEAPDMP